MATVVTLTAVEYAFAANAGFLRNVGNVAKGRKDAHGYKGEGYDIHVLGAVGEYVVSKALNVHWAGPGRLRADDVRGLQVRTRSEDHYQLLLHPEDADDDIFVLVTGRFPRFTVHGWCYGREGKLEAFWQDRANNGRPCYFVPNDVLRPLESLEVARA